MELTHTDKTNDVITSATHRHIEDGMLSPKAVRIPKNGLIQRKCAACEEEDKIQRKPLVSFIQRKEGQGGERASQLVSNRIDASKGRGKALPKTTKNFMESRFGTDFSKVNIHIGPEATQLSNELNAQAFTVGNDIYFNSGKFSPGTPEGKHLLAHELTHTIQQGKEQKSIQRRLFVSPSHHSLLPANDSASRLTQTQRFSMMDRLIQGLCQEFEVDSTTGEVLDKTRSTRMPSEYSGTSTPVGCCCLHLMTDSPNTWTIAVSELLGPHVPIPGVMVMSSSRVPIEFGAFTSSNNLEFQGEIPAFGHELCGHAALMELNAHPPLGDRTRTDVHDPTVGIENMIATEQGVPTADLRGNARSGSHRGESVDRIVVSQYPVNSTTVSSLPATERAKVAFAAKYAVANNSWVDVIGHTDSSGTTAINNRVSQERAEKMKDELVRQGIPTTITKFGLRGVNRFTRIQGVADSVPPHSPLNTNNANWRRVEILMAGFPAGAQNPVPGTPTGVRSTPRPRNVSTLARSSNPCMSLLVKKAYGIP